MDISKATPSNDIFFYLIFVLGDVASALDFLNAQSQKFFINIFVKNCNDPIFETI